MQATSYQVTDAQTGAIVATFKSRNRAYRAADKRDAAYGAVRFTVRPVWA